MFQSAIDIEPTTRCNADCSFCPRDVTPHEGLMTDEIFERSLGCASDLRAIRREMGLEPDPIISLCGLGEPLLHPKIATMVERCRSEGFGCTIGSNGSLLNERRSEALLEAGLQKIFLNVGERDEAYEEIYGLPFAKTRDRIVDFARRAGDDCEVIMVLVDHRDDRGHLADMEAYWSDLGITSYSEVDLMNRGGSLQVDHMQYETLLKREVHQAEQVIASTGGTSLCAVPFNLTFIGYDGLVYLCCGDWEKRAAVGSVFEPESVVALSNRLDPVRTREPICKTCNIDPTNRLAEAIRDEEAGSASRDDVLALAGQITGQSELLATGIDQWEEAAQRTGRLVHRRIPVRAL